MSEAESPMSYPPGQHPDLPPPPGTVGLTAWLKHNLFGSALNSLLTIGAVLLIAWCVPAFIGWAVFDATFTGDSTRECGEAGACWAVITAQPAQFLYGFYPDESIWRLILAFFLLFVALAPVFAEKLPYRQQLFWFSLAYPFIAAWLLIGGIGLAEVPTERWGGFMLTLVIGLTGIVASLPFGILLALGRRSDMPVVRILCTMFIEGVRGVPLITILFFASNMLPLFFPEGVSFDKLVRALFVVAMFSSAYMAEVIRGGLQAIPRGQYEAAKSLGLGYWQTMGLIILPQALKISIPGIVNNFIALFKDTSLVAIIGLFDVLGTGQLILRNENWIAAPEEVYLFIALIFWVPCFAMSRYSIWLEKRLSTEHAR